MSSLIWWSHYEPQQTFPDSPWRLSSSLCLPMIPNPHSEQHEPLIQDGKSTGKRREIHSMNGTYAKVVRWNTKILFIPDTKRVGFFDCPFLTFNFQKLNWLFFFLYNPGMSSRPPKYFSWTDDVLDCVTAHSRCRANCLESLLCTTCKRVLVSDLYIIALEQNRIYQKVCII